LAHGKNQSQKHAGANPPFKGDKGVDLQGSPDDQYIFSSCTGPFLIRKDQQGILSIFSCSKAPYKSRLKRSFSKTINTFGE
jgi:hypothetical protein